MTREPVLIRVDGTRAGGWERLSRCQVIAQAMQRRRRPCYFLSQLEPENCAQIIKRGGNEWLEADAPVGTPADLDEIIREIRRLKPAAVLVDAAGLAPDYLAELTTLGPLIVSVDTLAPDRSPCNLVLNPTLNADVEDYEVCPGTQILLGRRYPMVRSEVRRIRPLRSQEPPGPYRVLVAFGDDPLNQTARVAKILLNLPKMVAGIDLICRPQHAKFADWEKLVEHHADRMTLSTEASETGLKVSRGHLAFADGNSLALEFACVGMPAILMVQSHETQITAQRLEEECVASCLGHVEDVSDSDIKSAVQSLLQGAEERQVMSRCGRAFIDGRGPDRIVTALEVMLHPSPFCDLSEAA
jgi:spore coat polysaccharide biosynthesis predicted glycosyltransferase SpsG